MNILRRETLSSKLTDIARDAFMNIVLPVFQARYPGIENRFCVIVSSSVAFGLADKLSDLDMFLIFYEHDDYLRYSTKLERVLSEQISFPDAYQGACDKGVRVEIESFHRSDIENLMNTPDHVETNIKQTDWLLHWLINSITLYDPRGILSIFKSRKAFYPSDVVAYKQRLHALRSFKNFSYLNTQLHQGPSHFYAYEAFVKAVNGLMDYHLLGAGVLPPHHKWKPVIFETSLAGTAIGTLLPAAIEAYWRGQPYLEKLSACFESVEGVNRGSMSTSFDSENLALLFDWRLEHETFLTSIGKIRDGINVVTPDELGLGHIHGVGADYDSQMRISDRARSLVSKMDAKLAQVFESETGSMIRQRARYHNFIIWRKIRVIEKALKRNLPFVALWYTAEAILHVAEASYRNQGAFLPFVDELDPDVIEGPRVEIERIFREDGYLHHFFIQGHVEELISVLWDCYRSLQQKWRARGLISEEDRNDPLGTQFEIGYWKYEGLFN